MKETKGSSISGGLMLTVVLALYAVAIGAFIKGVASEDGWFIGGAILTFLVNTILSVGLFIIEPGGSKVLTLFGKYKGTIREAGLHWANPFYLKRSCSLRIRTLNGEKLKVNDLAGNPIEIAAVIVWQVADTYRAQFEVDNYEQFVALQSETSLRHSASIFPYDADDEVISLRRNTVEVSQHLKEELEERLAMAGVTIVEARLSHLAYASEIAGAMLRRQQATAVIAARQKIVEGAVGMVEMALARIAEHGVVTLDDERKANMVSNLMVVLCSEQAAQPVVNTGTLYN